MKNIENFIGKLSSVECTDTYTNLYHGESLESEIRRHNLMLYLNKIKSLNSKVLLVGEAPGHRGCRLTGIPFTCEKIMVDLPFFNSEKYKFINKKDQLEFENSSNIVWTHIKKIKPNEFPLLWNIYPFHPHKSNDTRSNRTPNKQEIEIGFGYLNELIELFNIKKIISVGRKAESKIKDLALDKEFIFHPSYGRNLIFKEGIDRIFTLS